MTIGSGGVRADPRPGWPFVYHGGAMVLREQAVLPVGSIALRYGVSVFEGIRVYRQESGTMVAWLLQHHLERLRNSCRLMGLDESVCATVPEIVDQLLSANGVAEDSYVRVAVSAGNLGGIGEDAESVLTVTVSPLDRKKWLAYGLGVRLAVSDRQRPAEPVFPSAAKNISAYAGPRLALMAAKREGYDSCVLLTAEGMISEAPTATVFLVEGGRLVTPRLTDAVLPGVTRAWVLAAARALEIDAIEEAVTPRRLVAADEVFLCGTGLEFGPVREVAGRELPGWPVCPVTTRLVDSYFEQVRGVEPTVAVDWTPTEVSR
jgi:branched-chain amino acid aminotransferase